MELTPLGGNYRGASYARRIQDPEVPLTEKISLVRDVTIEQISGLWLSLKHFIDHPKKLTQKKLEEYAALYRESWSNFQKQILIVSDNQPNLSMTEKAVLDDLLHEGPKAFIDVPPDGKWRDLTSSLMGVLVNISWFAKHEECAPTTERYHMFFEALSFERILARSKLADAPFRTLMDALGGVGSLELPTMAMAAQLVKPFTSAIVFCATIEQDFNGLGAKIECRVAPEYARQILHREFEHLRDFVIPILINNGIEAMSQLPENQRLIQIKLVPVQNEWHILVSDTGPGLPPEVLASLFQRGVSSKGEGRGHGLELSRRMLTQTEFFNLADIRLANTCEHGTTFEIILHSPFPIVAQLPEMDDD